MSPIMLATQQEQPPIRWAAIAPTQECIDQLAQMPVTWSATLTLPAGAATPQMAVTFTVPAGTTITAAEGDLAVVHAGTLHVFHQGTGTVDTAPTN